MDSTDRTIINNAIDLVIERLCGGMNGEYYLSEITDCIDPDRSMTKEKRMAEIHFHLNRIKMGI